MGYSDINFTRNKISYQSFMGSISKDMRRLEKEARSKAGTHVRKALRRVCSSLFGSDSNITKGVGKRDQKTVTLVGVGPPAQAAHLIEFGTEERFHSEDSKFGPNHPTGKIDAKPFVVPTYEAEAPAVKEILSKEWF